jgi:hypothetical protein
VVVGARCVCGRRAAHVVRAPSDWLADDLSRPTDNTDVTPLRPGYPTGPEHGMCCCPRCVHARRAADTHAPGAQGSRVADRRPLAGRVAARHQQESSRRSSRRGCFMAKGEAGEVGGDALATVPQRKPRCSAADGLRLPQSTRTGSLVDGADTAPFELGCLQPRGDDD